MTGYRTTIVEGALPPDLAAGVSELARRCDPTQILGYHAPDYQLGMTQVLNDRLRHLLLLEGDAVAGYLPFREKAGPAGVVVNALPFFGPNGLVLAQTPATAAALVAAFREETAARPDVLSVVLYTPFQGDATAIAAAFEPDRRIARMTQYLDLEQLVAWPKKRRGDLKRAAEAGFVMRPASISDADVLYRIYLANCRDVGIPEKPRAYFDLTLTLASANVAVPWLRPHWLAAEHQGRVVGGLLTMRGRRTASYTIPIAEAELRPLQPVAALIDAGVAEARRAGIRYWNFESSPHRDDPVFKYKERWGALQGDYEVQVKYPNGPGRLNGLRIEELKQAYPFYFVCPYDDLAAR